MRPQVFAAVTWNGRSPIVSDTVSSRIDNERTRCRPGSPATNRATGGLGVLTLPLFENMVPIVRPNFHRNSEGGVGGGIILAFRQYRSYC